MILTLQMTRINRQWNFRAIFTPIIYIYIYISGDANNKWKHDLKTSEQCGGTVHHFDNLSVGRVHIW